MLLLSSAEVLLRSSWGNRKQAGTPVNKQLRVSNSLTIQLAHGDLGAVHMDGACAPCVHALLVSRPLRLCAVPGDSDAVAPGEERLRVGAGPGHPARQGRHRRHAGRRQLRRRRGAPPERGRVCQPCNRRHLILCTLAQGFAEASGICSASSGSMTILCFQRAGMSEDSRTP